MNRKYFLYSEYAWLVIGIVAVGIAVFEINRVGFGQGKIYLIIPAIAFLWYAFKRSFRKRMDKRSNQD